MGVYQRYVKRCLDVVVSAVSLLLLSPLFLVLAIWLHFANKGAGVLFAQERPGYKDQIFKIYKFKTMTDERSSNGNLLPDHERLTAVGRFLRASALDELPQLWNVLKGDMSLIGPRPLLELLPSCQQIVNRESSQPLNSYEEMRRHEVLPGITGWAQVHGRTSISWAQKMEYDVWYVDNVSFKLDLKILLATLRMIICNKESYKLQK